MLKTLRLTRIGCLAVHLMPYRGDLDQAVARIVRDGPRTPKEREAVRKANAEDLPDPKIRGLEVKR